MIKLFWYYFNQTSEELLKTYILNFFWLIKYYQTNTEQLHNNYRMDFETELIFRTQMNNK